MTPTPKPNDLSVWYIPQVPMSAFRVSVPDIATARLVLSTLCDFSAFEYEHRVKPDYSDAAGIARWESDGEGGFDWFDVDEEDLHSSDVA